MKFTKIIFNAAIVAAVAFSSTKALAASGEISVTGTIKVQNTNSVSKDAESSKVLTLSLKNAQLYSLITNAVFSAATNGIATTNFPANGYIAFDPNGTDGNVTGTFYVTNKSGFYYPLSGLDTNENYYSFIELDTYNPGTDVGAVDFGFSDNFNGVQAGSLNNSTGNGSETVTSTALFYVHDNPYSFNDGNSADQYYSNINAIEIRGIAQMTLTFKTNAVTKWSISLQGTGNAIIDNSQNAVVTSGHMTASQ